MKLAPIVKSFLKESLTFKNSFDGEFKVWKFYDSNQYIGHIHVRLKRGWNQLHIEIEPKIQGKGYSYRMIELVINELAYISIPEGRIINDLIHKIIKKFENNSEFEVWKTKYDEWIISNKKKSRKEIDKVFK